MVAQQIQRQIGVVQMLVYIAHQRAVHVGGRLLLFLHDLLTERVDGVSCAVKRLLQRHAMLRFLHFQKHLHRQLFFQNNPPHGFVQKGGNPADERIAQPKALIFLVQLLQDRLRSFFAALPDGTHQLRFPIQRVVILHVGAGKLDAANSLLFPHALFDFLVRRADSRQAPAGVGHKHAAFYILFDQRIVQRLRQFHCDVLVRQRGKFCNHSGALINIFNQFAVALAAFDGLQRFFQGEQKF